VRCSKRHPVTRQVKDVLAADDPPQPSAPSVQATAESRYVAGLDEVLRAHDAVIDALLAGELAALPAPTQQIEPDSAISTRSIR
jgi:hypothetical protein